MIKLLSYMYPITKKVKSEYNDTLEITWYNGKKYLNTKNANYSYGALQEILKFGLNKIALQHVRSILVLGLGGGSVIKTLQDDFNYQKHITAVDIDPVIIDIATSEFNVESSSQLNIICEDAFQFVKNNTQQFDLIIVDLFIDIHVPKPFLDVLFWERLIKIKSTNGSIIFNASLETTRSKALNHVIEFLKSNVYKVTVYDQVNQTNTLVISESL